VNVFWVNGDGEHIDYGHVAPGERRVQHTFVGHVWLITNPAGDRLAVFAAGAKSSLAVIEPGGAGESRRAPGNPPARTGPEYRSPDGKWDAVVHHNDLFLREVATGTEWPLTTGATATNTYARDEEFDRNIDMNYTKADPAEPTAEMYWSPDSTKVVAMCLKPGATRRVYLIESSPEDQVQPKLDSYPYLKPGDAVPIRKPHLFDVASRREIPVADTLFPNPWSTDDLRWSPDSKRFTFVYNQRGHQVLRIVAVDATNGLARAIVDEQSSTFICYSSKYYAEYLDDTGEIIWMSERDGWNHLYLYDASTGAVKNQITKGEWVVRSVERVDREHRQIWFQAGGIRPGQDPYYLHLCRVNFDGTGLTILTAGDGTHAEQFSPDRRWFIDTWSRVDCAPVNELRSSEDGRLVCALEKADVAEWLAGGGQFPERFVARARDGVTDIYGVIWRPQPFSRFKKYPVIEDIYAGPQDSFTPKPFRAKYQQQTLANRGFVVVQMDGMGTSNRSKKFHDYCWQNLADAGFPDRILWIRAAAAKYPALDLQRVGLYGTSAGGQDALRGLLDHGDFYRAGVADSGCHDNRMDKIWWNEQWLGWPVGDAYVRSSNVVDAHKLQGALLLMYGEMDRNVDPASTMQVVNALIKSGKNFELLAMPGAGHGVARTPYGEQRLEDFFIRHLLTRTAGTAGFAQNAGGAL
jgi:dipeptidyl aminopeptidase/acylaminoacyl peptidase